MSVNDTKEQLLDTAERLFADKGYESVSVRDIAAEADVNLAAINYHFQGKDNLYQEVLLRRVVPKRDKILVSLQQVMIGGKPELNKLVSAFVRAHLEDALTSEQGAIALRLVARELTEPKHGAEIICREMIAPVHTAFSHALIQAKPELDMPKCTRIISSIVGQVVHFTMRWRNTRPGEVPGHDTGQMRHAFPSLFGSLEDYITETVAHVTRFSVGGVEALLNEEGK
ncbi:CerR family C-terminal domain-containing protein [bacterium]|jgi:AcrR family transcriptional regulator|nr:CerR family C-terminal domain-containing protein [bacterium]MBT7310863.1 CerR family C-terminal domain-containing protein [bacterium]